MEEGTGRQGKRKMELLPLKMQRIAKWKRKASLAYEPGGGVVRLYPTSSAPFDEIVRALNAILPSSH